MSGTNPTEKEQLNLRAAYDQICTGYRSIDEFRAKLLGLLPLASGAGIFLLLSDVFTKDSTSAFSRRFVSPIGAFGFLVTLGLYFYELRGIQYCIHMIAAGPGSGAQTQSAGQVLDSAEAARSRVYK